MDIAPPSRAELAALVDHTLLRPEATAADVAALCAEAAELGVRAICVAPSFLPLAAGLLGDDIDVCTVVGFPAGSHHTAIKAAEAERAVADGASEIDMVLDVGAIKGGRWRTTTRELRTVREVTEGSVLKVILETAVLTDDEILRACVLAQDEGADFVKTSTGFHPAGGATTHAVSLMASTVGGALGIKASGGIRTTEAALAMVTAGATRLGLSATRAVLDGLDRPPAAARPTRSGAPAAAPTAPPGTAPDPSERSGPDPDPSERSGPDPHPTPATADPAAVVPRQRTSDTDEIPPPTSPAPKEAAEPGSATRSLLRRPRRRDRPRSFPPNPT